MKGPLMATVLVLVVGGGAGWWQQRQAGKWRQVVDGLHDEAANRGIALRVNASAGRKLRAMEDRNSAKVLHKVNGLVERVELVERGGGRPDEGLREQIVSLAVDLAVMSPSNMRRFLAKLRTNPDLSDDTKARLVGQSILMIAGEHPDVALRLLEESKDLLGEGGVFSQAMGNALQTMAEQSPEAALEWLKKNPDPLSGEPREELVHAVLGGVAKHDPVVAFRMLGELGLDASEDACEVIASALADSQKGREALVRAMKGYAEEMENPRGARKVSAAVMEAVGRAVAKNSFDTVSRWLDAEALSESDMAAFAGGLSWFSTGKETGDWLGWMAGRLSEEQLAEPVESLVADWVQEDYLAAGEWLVQVPAGPLKTPAVKAYAEMVAAYDPEVATQWAMTISDREARQATLRAIHENWPDDDEEGAARFAAKHGIE